jgi:uncharacterized membrane protein YfcA
VGDASALDLTVLAAVGVAAGWINTIAGAGSLLLLPALIFTGLPADAANATNRLAVLATSLAAVAGYRRAGLAVGRNEAVLAAAAVLGGAIGSFVATLLDPGEVQRAIVVAMGVMLVLSLVPPRRAEKAEATPSSAAAGEDGEGGGRTDTPAENAASPGLARVPPPTSGMIAAFVLIGIYGGFLQAGLGIVVLLYLSLAHGVGLVASNVVKSTVTLALTVIAITVFAWRGERMDLVRGGVLALASAIGSWGGARATVALGDRFVRAVVVVAVLASIGKLIRDLP